jgi:SAM-dependent methyltransferase
MSMTGKDEEEVIREQIRYYDRRAPEYDESTKPQNDPFAAEGAELEAALARFGPTGKILEIAGGTGQWTRWLTAYSDDVTCVDASAEMLKLNRHKVGDAPVRYINADVFSWEPDSTYDTIVFANWLSHVPPTHFERFWALVDSALAPSGRVFFVDEGFNGAWRHEEWGRSENEKRYSLVRRRLEDGTEFRAVKIYWDAAELQAKLNRLGWAIEVRSTGSFLWGAGTRSVS